MHTGIRPRDLPDARAALAVIEHKVEKMRVGDADGRRAYRSEPSGEGVGSAPRMKLLLQKEGYGLRCRNFIHVFRI